MWKVARKSWHSMDAAHRALHFGSPSRSLGTMGFGLDGGLHHIALAKKTRNRINGLHWRCGFMTEHEGKSDMSLIAVRTMSTAALSDDHSVIPFILADIGEGIAEVELLQWFVHEGDQVHQFDRICEVQSDKATVEITSRYDGRITSLEHEKGDMVKVGTPLLFLDSNEDPGSSNLHTASTKTQPMEEDEKLRIPTIASQYRLSTDQQAKAEETPAVVKTFDNPNVMHDKQGPRSTPHSFSKVLTTPAIRKLAMEYSFDLSTIVGTGPRGRVLKCDVLTTLKERGLIPAKEEPKKIPDLVVGVASTSNIAANKATTSKDASITSIDQAILPLEQDTAMDIRGYNRLMVQSMTASLQIPHMVYADEINVTSLRTQYKANLPFLPYCIKATSMALSKYPLLNSSFDAEANRVMLWADHNIGIAMDTPRGLIVPVIKQVQKKSLIEIVEELRRLKNCAKESAVPLDDLQGATFTLSNIGAIGGGGTYMSPIVTSPQVAIGALGQVQRVPRFASENSIEIYEAYIVNISWGGDHRVVDGATMARYHTQWKKYLQDPICLIQEMK